MNKPVKVSVNGRRQGYIDLHRTFWGRVWFKTKLYTARGFVLVLAVFIIGSISIAFAKEHFPKEIQMIETIREVEKQAPILARIADCESGDRTPGGSSIKGSASQFDSNGQVLINATRDMGKYQINVPIWGKKAKELGYDLSTEVGNEAMAKWIYTNKGTEPWSSSANCWRK